MTKSSMIVALFVVSVMFTHAVSAQTPSAPAPSGGAEAPAGPPPEIATPNSPAVAGPSKRVACRAAGRQQGLRGPDLADEVAVCMAEARVDCLKQAIGQKIPLVLRAKTSSKAAWERESHLAISSQVAGSASKGRFARLSVEAAAGRAMPAIDPSIRVAGLSAAAFYRGSIG
jgi:hypothetical protein